VNINVDPLNGENVMVSFSNYSTLSVFFSANGGQSFDDIGGNLEENSDGTGSGPSIRWGEIVPLNDGGCRYYLGTSTGAYSTESLLGLQTAWEREGASSIGQSVVRMLCYRPLDGKIVAATHGARIFAATVDNFLRIENEIPLVEKFEVMQPYPNPFNDKVTMEFTTPEEAIVLVRVIDMTGRWVSTPLWGTQAEGINHVTWDGNNTVGHPVDEGVYLMALSYQGKITVEK